MAKASTNHAHGHRERAKKKFLDNAKRRVKLEDYEALELLLTHSIPRKDTKPIAKELLARFKTFKNIYKASDKDRLDIPDLGASTINLLNVQHEFIKRVLSKDPKKRRIAEPLPCVPEPILNPAQDAYHEIITHKEKGFWLMSLGAQGKTIALTKIEGIADINKPFADLRPFVKVALDTNASSVFLCSNRPDNNKNISHEDLQNTEKLSDLLNNLSINLRDHFIILENLIIFVVNQYMLTVEDNNIMCEDDEKDVIQAINYDKEKLKNLIQNSTAKGLKDLDDYEILAYLLERANIGKDTETLLNIFAKHSINLRNILFTKFTKIKSIIDTDLSSNLCDKIFLFLVLYRDFTIRYLLSDYLKSPLKDRLPLQNMNDFVQIAYCQLAYCEIEEIWLAHFDNNMKLIAFEPVTKQGASAVSISMSEITTHILASKAHSLIVCHNHPGGGINASNKDKDSTVELRKILEEININLIEHIVVSDISCNLIQADKTIYF